MGFSTPFAAADGWTLAEQVWTFGSASTFTVPGDQTAIFTKGTRIKCTNTTLKYFVVASSSFGGGTTTVTIFVNTDYVLANAAITANFYSYQASPAGYPTWFTYNCSPAGWAATPTQTTSKYKVDGASFTCIWNVSGTSNATTVTVAIPVAAVSSPAVPYGFASDSSANPTTPGRIQVQAASTSVLIFKDMAAGAWTNTGVKQILAEITADY